MNRVYFTIENKYVWAYHVHKDFKVFFLEDRYEYQFKDHVERTDFWDDLFYWCKDQYGEPGDRWGLLNSGDYLNYVCFMAEADACFFKMRWC